MQIIKFATALGLTVLFIFTLSLNNPYGSSLPPIGPFFNPFSGIWQNAATGSIETMNLKLAGLQEEVKVLFDERQVPHIFANKHEDLFYAQGYVTAKLRLWQMDMSARSAGGRLSEVLGERTLENDRRQRRRGMLWAAERAWEAWEGAPEEKRWVESYSKGVNDYISSLSPSDYPYEYKLLDFAPEPWTPVKSSLFFKNMAQMLSSRNQDLGATNARAFLGEELFDFLYPEHNPKQSPIIPEGTPWDFTPIALKSDTNSGREMQSNVLYPHEGLPQPPAFLGSNNWAVSGKKTADGYPILANDPHLALSLPSIWFEVQLHTPDFNAYGVSLPGLPGLAIGFNEHYAWGETNVGHDVLDWYRITWSDEEKTRYLLDGSSREVEVRTEKIEVRGRNKPRS